MGVLGKDLLDYRRPRTHVKIHFGQSAYWIEDDQTLHPYGETLVALLNYGSEPAAPKNKLLRLYLSAGEDVKPVRERYVWFLQELFRDVPCEKKKGQRKLPLAEQVYQSCLEAFVSGVSLGQSPEVDAPQVNIQYAVWEMKDGAHELVEKMYFDRLSDFVYVELMKGLQKGFVPKRCPNCARWFLQQPGLTYSYCDGPAPGGEGKTCRDIGSTASFKDKVRNHDVWKVHQRAYKKYFARTKKGTMSRADFEAWERKSERLRERALTEHERAESEEQRAAIVGRLAEELNRA